MDSLSSLGTAFSATDATRRLTVSVARARDRATSTSSTSAPAPTLADLRVSARTISDALSDAATEASRRASTSAGDVAKPVATAVAKVNDVLGTLGSSTMSAELRVALLNAVRGAGVSGLSVSSSDGKDSLVADTAALEATLANDPRALDALVTGPDGVSEALSVALADATASDIANGGTAAQTTSAAKLSSESGLAATIRAAQVSSDAGTIRLLNVISLRSLSTTSARVDRLA